MEIIILSDNTPHPMNPALQAEHGLSFFIRTNDGRHILCDMGKGNLFWKNAEQLQIDIKQCNWAFISHAHNDHGGGLRYFLENTADTPVYLSAETFKEEHYSHRHGNQSRNISIDRSLETVYADRLYPLAGSCWLTPQIAVVHNKCHQFKKPFGNNFLTSRLPEGKEEADNFSHELSLAILTEKGLVIIAPCSHQGAANIIHSCQSFTGMERVYAYIGGLHFVDENQADEEVATLKNSLQKIAPSMKVYTGHCTCDAAKNCLIKQWKNTQIFHVGSTLQL